jgi:predicted ABC-type ATPase
MGELRKWDNDIYKYDVTEASRAMNPWLANYGRDRLTYNPETTFSSASFLARNEASQSHGYPVTAWLQLGLVYACGLYTAKEQGIVKKRVFFQKYW